MHELFRLGIYLLNSTKTILVEQDKKNMRYPTFWMDYQRTFPHNSIKIESYKSAYKQALNQHKKSSLSDDYNWEFAGPENVGGRINDIAIHPDNTSTIYVAAATGGIFKTTDEGSSWAQVFNNAPVISMGDIAIDPNNEDIIYAGTGDPNYTNFSFLGDGIYKSLDAGISWTNIGLENSAYIARIIVDYNNSDNIYVAACGYLVDNGGERGVYKSNDGGASWQNVLFLNDSISAIDLVQHPTNPNILYASMWERRVGLMYQKYYGDGSGLWKTENGGETWIELTNGLPTGDDVGRIGIAIAKSNPDVLYTFYDMPGLEVGIYKTTNAGNNWTQTNDGSLSNVDYAFGWYFGQIRVAPDNENIVYVLGVTIFKTQNGGSSWIEITDYDNLHVDHHALWFDEASNRIYLGNDGGLYFTDDEGSNWNKINNLPLTQFYHIEIDHQFPDRIYGGNQDNGTVRTMTGNVDDWEELLPADGAYTIVDYEDNSIIFAEGQMGVLHKSTDGGNSFDFIGMVFVGENVNFVAPYVIHPTEHNTLYFCTNKVWKTIDGGNTWSIISADLTNGFNVMYYNTISTISISQINPNILVVGADDGRVHISTDEGANWQDISAGLPERWITRVENDPFDENTIYATVSGFRWNEPLPHVFKSSDLGQNWQDISGNLPELPVNIIVADPGVENSLFIGTDAGVYYTANGGDYWINIMGDVPLVPVLALDIHNPTRTLVMGTYGLSAYKMDITDLVSINNITQNNNNQISVYPNPFYLSKNNELHIVLDAPQNNYKTIMLHDVKGRLIKQFDVENIIQNTIKIPLNGMYNLPTGIYVLTLISENDKQSVKFELFP